jgi:hypothetical protein
MTHETGTNHLATTGVLVSLVVRSFGVAAGIGIAVLLAAALFSG